MFKDVDKSMLMKLVALHVVVITVSNALVAIPVEIFGVKLTWAAFTFRLVVIATDLTVRHLGKTIARQTIAANIIDTYTFFAVAFNNSADEYMAANWVEIAGSQTVLKIIVGLVVFLPAYGILLNRLQKTYKLK